MVELLTFWGVDITLSGDGKRRYFALTIPEHWSTKRRATFATGLREGIKQAENDHAVGG